MIEHEQPRLHEAGALAWRLHECRGNSDQTDCACVEQVYDHQV